MRVCPLLTRLRPGEPDCRYCLAAGDVVTALGSLLFLPSAALLAAIGLRGRRRDRAADERSA